MNHAFMFNTFEQIRKLLTEKELLSGIPAVQKLLSVGHETLSKLGKVSPKYPSVITHGDAWTTNFLFKYDDDQGTWQILKRIVSKIHEKYLIIDPSVFTETLVDVKFVDFQMSRVRKRKN